MATSYFYPTTLATALPGHCRPTERWLVALSSAFHICVPTSLAFMSTALGNFSIVSWLFAQLPQIYKNYKLKSASGLSIYFLTEWLFGDLTNLLGAVLTGQTTWQVILAAYYVTVDIFLVVQYVWYVHAKPWRKARLVDYGHHSREYRPDSESLLEGISPSNSIERPLPTQTSHNKEDKSPEQRLAIQKGGTPTQTLNISSFNEKAPIFKAKRTGSNRTAFLLSSPQNVIMASLACVALANAQPLHTPAPLYILLKHQSLPSASLAEFAGRVFSWISTLLYLVSRLPQIYKNFRRRSTSGLSPSLFIAAFFGNLFYSTSILTNPLAWSSSPPFGLHGWAGADGSDQWRWVTLAAPFWLGAAGVLVMDAIIGVQFLVYGEGIELEVLDEGRNGVDHWKRVTGWMRGWVPTPSKAEEQGVTSGEEGQPLMRSRSSEETGGGEQRTYGAT